MYLHVSIEQQAEREKAGMQQQLEERNGRLKLLQRAMQQCVTARSKALHRADQLEQQVRGYNYLTIHISAIAETSDHNKEVTIYDTRLCTVLINSSNR